MARYILPFLFMLTWLSVASKEKCTVTVTAAEGARPYELVIMKGGEDPKNSSLRTKLEDGSFECEIESDEIEMLTIVDFGEVMETGCTGRTADFYVEDGANVKIYFDGKALNVESDGAEWQKKKQMDDLAQDWIASHLTDNMTEEQNATLNKEYHQWVDNYYIQHQMLSFLLYLNEALVNFRFTDENLSRLLDIYHQYYEDKYPGLKVHDAIVSAENAGYQILGRKYNDYTAYNTELEEVRASDYFTGKPTLVICWATWCAPCRKEAKELIPLYEKYKTRGLNAFSLAREFESADAMRAAVAEDNYPWPCLLDLDEKFGIFDRHGVTSSALILIDADGQIVAAGYTPEDIEGKLEEILPEEI